MAVPSPLKIDLSEKFVHLQNAAISEAVIEFRGPAVSVFGEATVKFRLRDALPDYPQQDSQHKATFQVKVQLATGENEPHNAAQSPSGAAPTKHKAQWDGIRVRSKDGRQIAAFKPTTFLFSLLPPYSDWTEFSTEALRLWEVHRELTRIDQIQRVGVRYINRIPVLAESWELSDYLTVCPPEPAGISLPFVNFLHQDTLVVPGHPYQANCIRTIVPATPQNKVPQIVLDIDVSTTVPVPLVDLRNRLDEMRWLKNKLFFGMISQKTLSQLQ